MSFDWDTQRLSTSQLASILNLPLHRVTAEVSRHNGGKRWHQHLSHQPRRGSGYRFSWSPRDVVIAAFLAETGGKNGHATLGPWVRTALVADIRNADPEADAMVEWFDDGTLHVAWEIPWQEIRDAVEFVTRGVA